MKTLDRWPGTSAAVLAALALTACGGGGSGGAQAPNPPSLECPAVTTLPASAMTPEPGAPAITNNTATDGLNWLNFRRQQTGLSVLTRNALIDAAATGHSNYQRQNTVTHVQEVGKPGFTGVQLLDRLQAVGYATPSYFYGEVISASTSTSGTYLAEELITAIYHRFAIFEPRFKEIGAGSATNGSGYTIFTNDFAANNGYGPGIGKGNIVTWPTDGKTGVVRNFLSDYEAPDPVPDKCVNEVGYPVSVHADADVRLTVSAFTIRPRGGSNLSVRLLSQATDSANMGANASAASIVPLSVLAAATVYDVTFSGTADGVAITKNWSFTTK
jgi:uncharacterized protein YkwD